MRPRDIGALLSLTSLALAPARSARAAPESPEQIAAARALGLHGHALAAAGKCDEAIEPLARAEELYHAPTTAEWLGACQVAVGKIVAGAETLRRVAHEELASTAPRAFVDAQARARAELTLAESRIAGVTIHVAAPPEATLTVQLDGEPFPKALLDVERPADPGAHEVRASAPGFVLVDARLTLGAGEHRELSLALVPDPATPTASPKPTPEPPVPSSVPGSGEAERESLRVTRATEPPPAASRATRDVAIGSLVVGGVGVGVGAASGLVALDVKSSLDHQCSSSHACAPGARSDINLLGAAATASTVGFGVGLAGVGAGLVLLFAARPAGQPGAGVTGVTGGVTVRPWLGPGSAGLGGSF